MTNYNLGKLTRDLQKCPFKYDVIVGKTYVTYPDNTFYDEEGQLMNTKWFEWSDLEGDK